MELEYERTIEDMIEFNLFHISHSPTIKRQMLYMRGFVALLTIILTLSLIYLLVHKLDIYAYIISTIGGITIFVLYPYFAQLDIIHRLRKFLGEGDNKAVLGHQIITLSPDGVFSKTQAGESKLNWSSFIKVAQNEKKYFFLYISATNALVIPPGAFTSEIQRQEFLNYIDTHLEQKTTA